MRVPFPSRLRDVFQNESLVAKFAEIKLLSAKGIGIFSASATAGTKLERERFDGASGQACHHRIVGMWRCD